MSLKPLWVVFDYNDGERVGDFWAAALGRTATREGVEAVSLLGDPRLELMQVPEPKTAKNRMHLDWTVADREAEVHRLLGLGATRLEDHEDTIDGEEFEWTVLADPEGNELCIIRSNEDDPPSGMTLDYVTFDAADPRVLTRFWAAALERDLPSAAASDDDDTAIDLLGEPNLYFIPVPEPKTAKSRMHLDWESDDREAEVRRLLALGATKLWDHVDDEYEWTALADPEGNEFCVFPPDSA